MKRQRYKFLLIGGVCCLLVFVYALRLAHRTPQETSSPPIKPVLVQSNLMQAVHHNPLNVIKAAEFSDAERASLQEKFETGIKPAIAKWLTVYGAHSPFKLDEVTFDKFHNRLGRDASYYSYTFVFNGITISIREVSGKFTMDYLMVRQGGLALVTVPKSGFVPDLSVPIAREEVIRLVQADTGVEFKPNEVVIRPTGAACVLNGGAFVHLIPAGLDPDNGLNTKINMVFDSNGNLVNYERDPFF